MEFCASCSTAFESRETLSMHMLLSHGLILAEPVVSVTALPERNLSQQKDSESKSSNHSYGEHPSSTASAKVNIPPDFHKQNVFNVFKVFSRNPEGGATRLRYSSLQLLACNDFGVISATEKSLERPKLSFYSQSETFFNTPYQMAGSNVVAGQETVSDPKDLKTTESVEAKEAKEVKNTVDVKGVVKGGPELKTEEVDKKESTEAGRPQEVKTATINVQSQDRAGADENVTTSNSKVLDNKFDKAEDEMKIDGELDLDDGDSSDSTFDDDDTDTDSTDYIERLIFDEISSTETAKCPLCEHEFELSSSFTRFVKNHFSRWHPGYKENPAFIDFCKRYEITVCPIAGCDVFRNTKDGMAMMITHMTSHENTKSTGTVIEKKEEEKLEVSQEKKSKSCCPFDNCNRKDLTDTNMKAHFKKFHPNKKVSKTFLRSHGFYGCPELDCTKFFIASDSNVSNIITHYRNDHPGRDSEDAVLGCKKLARKLARESILKEEELRKKKRASKTNDKASVVSDVIKQKCPAEGCSFKGKGSRSFLMHLRDVHATEYFSSFTLREYGLKKCRKPGCKALFMRSHNFESVYNTHLINCHSNEEKPEMNQPGDMDVKSELLKLQELTRKAFMDFPKTDESLKARHPGESNLNSIKKQSEENKKKEVKPDDKTEDALDAENEDQPCLCPFQGCGFVGKNLYGTRSHFPRAHKNHSLPNAFIQKYNLICCPEPGCSSNFTPTKNIRFMLLVHYNEKHNDVSMDNLNHHFVNVWKNAYGGPTKRKTSTAKQEPEQARMEAPKEAKSIAVPSTTPSPSSTPNYRLNAPKGQFVDVSKSNINLRCVAAGCKESFTGCSIAICLQTLLQHFRYSHSGQKAPERLISGLNNTDSVILCPYNGCGEFRAGDNSAQDIHVHLSEHKQDDVITEEQQKKVKEREIRVQELLTSDGRSIFRMQCLVSGCNITINSISTESCIRKLQAHYEIYHLVDFPQNYKLVRIPFEGEKNGTAPGPNPEATEATKRKSELDADASRREEFWNVKLSDLGSYRRTHHPMVVSHIPKIQKVEASNAASERINDQHQPKQGSPIPRAPSSPYTPAFNKKVPASTDTIPNLIRSSSTTPPRPQPRAVNDNVIKLVDD